MEPADLHRDDQSAPVIRGRIAKSAVQPAIDRRLARRRPQGQSHGIRGERIFPLKVSAAIRKCPDAGIIVVGENSGRPQPFLQASR